MSGRGNALDSLSQRRSGRTGSHLLRQALREVSVEAAGANRASRGQRRDNSSGEALPSYICRLSESSQSSRRGRLQGAHELAVAAQHSQTSQLSILFTRTPLFAQLQRAAAQHARTQTAQAGKTWQCSDEDSLGAVCDRLLFTAERPQSTLTAEAELLRIPRTTFRRDMVDTASAVHVAAMYSWAVLFERVLCKISDGAWEFLMFVKNRVYDETPIKLRLHPKPQQQGAPGMRPVGGDKSLAKVLQTKFSLGFLVRHRESSEMLFWSGVVPTTLQALERTRGEDLCAAQAAVISSVPGIDDMAHAAKLSVDLTTADRYLANGKAERGLQGMRPGDTPLHFDCEVHKASTATSWMLKPVDSHVSGMIAASLVLRNAGSLAQFRNTLLEVIQESLVMNYAPCPTDSEAHRQEIYDLFLGLNLVREDSVSGLRKQRAAQRAVLSHYLAGDLTDPLCVQFCTRGANLSEDEALHIVRAYLLHCLVPCSMPTYPRHRWFGGEASCDWIGLLEAHHSLFSRTMSRMLGGIGPSHPLAVVVSSEGAEQPAGWAAAVAAVLNEGGRVADAEEGANPPLQDPDEPAIEAPPKSSAFDWVEFNKSMRKKVLVWTRADIHTGVCLMRWSMNITSRLLGRMLRMASSRWEREQQLEKERSYRLLEALLKNDLDPAFTEIQESFKAVPPGIPKQRWTRVTRSLSFQLLSRLAGSLHFLCESLREGCPFRIAALLLPDGYPEIAAQEILDMSPCLCDALTLKLREMFPTAQQLSAEPVRAMIRGIAHMAQVDVANIECGHAAVRHVVEGKSNQTWDTDLPLISAEPCMILNSFGRFWVCSHWCHYLCGSVAGCGGSKVSRGWKDRMG